MSTKTGFIIAAAGGLVVLAAGAGESVAQTLYTVNQTIGSGNVTGQITTDGATGVLSQTDIKSWNLVLTGAGGVTTNLVSGTASVHVIGGDLSATGRNLTFNSSGADGGYLLFQSNLFSGQQYYCNNTNWFGCKPGASVVPQSFSDASAQYLTLSGLQVIATAAGPSSDVTNASLNDLALSHLAQMATQQLTTSVYLGANEQVNCSNCGGAYASVGSVNLSTHGRKSLTREWTWLYGLGYGAYRERGADVARSLTIATALRFDPAWMGTSRPYFEVGLSGAPDQSVTYRRPYVNGSAAAMGTGHTKSSFVSGYIRGGWVARLTPRDEVGASVTVNVIQQHQGPYAEIADASNPYIAVIAAGTDRLKTEGVGLQVTHLFGRRVELTADAQWYQVAQAHSGIAAAIAGGGSTGATTPHLNWAQPGLALGYRVGKRGVINAFVNATMGGRKMGTSAHGGLGYSVRF